MNNSSVFNVDSHNGKPMYPKLPDLIYFDTSFLLNAYMDAGDKHSVPVCRDFIQELNKSNSTMVISYLALEELNHFLRKYFVENALKREKLNQSEIDSYINNHPEINKPIADKIRSIKAELESIFLLLDYHADANLFDKTVEIIEKYGLNQMDAKHVAICIINGISSIATDDSGFGKLDGFNIYTSNIDFVRSCRTRPNVFIEISSSTTHKQD